MGRHRGQVIIAIDGPAGAGKSTIARMVARRLGYRYIDTGAMYRAVAWKALQEGIPLDAGRALTSLARRSRLRFRRKKGASHIHIGGRDVAPLIRTNEVSRATNQLATVKGVRRVLRGIQKRMGRGGGVVMEGRDIGTVVFPKAQVKIYLDASPMERARRRARELAGRNGRVSLRAIAREIRKRDHKDRTRRDSPLRVARGAVVLDSTRLSRPEVVRRIVKHTRQTLKEQSS